MKPLQVHWSEDAVVDLGEIVDFIALDAPTRARRALSKIRTLADRLEALAMRGRVVPELEAVGILTYRELITAPWRILYRIDGKRVYVVGIFDARRDLEEVLLARFQ